MTTDPAEQRPETDIFRLIYCSTMTIQGGPAVIGETVADIVRVARSLNQAADITGALLVDEESFAQVLEGPIRAVKELFGRIYLDARNRDVILLESGFVPKREFSGWSMAFIGTLSTAEMKVIPSDMSFDKHLLSERGSATLRLLLYVLKANQNSLLPEDA